MKTTSFLAITATFAIGALSVFSYAPKVEAHCQIPCGIYDDDAALSEMALDATTIKKAVGEIETLASATDAQSKQQFVRWTNNKEAHAANVQQIALDYFLAQRIKLPEDESGMEAYNKHLGLLHKIIVHAMKCKQNADAEAATALEEVIAEFTEAYNAK